MSTTMLTLVLLAALAVRAPTQTPPTALPYAANHKPDFVTAQDATFLRDDDILLGVVSSNVAKAYPAADLTQHGAVSDQLPDGPISVTWCGVCNTGLVFRADVNGRTLTSNTTVWLAATKCRRTWRPVPAGSKLPVKRLMARSKARA